MADAEVIVVGVDNSLWVPRHSDILRDQLEAVEFYCKAKFEENPDTVVGLYTMSSFDSGHLVYPTRSIEELVAEFPRVYSGCGQVDLLSALSYGCIPLVDPLSKPYKKKRLVLFVGGLSNLPSLYVKKFGKATRDKGIAVDVIDFYTGGPPEYPTSKYQYGRSELVAFIKSCNDNDNSHIVHVGPTRSIRDALSKSGLLKTTPCQSEEQNANLKRRLGVEESSAACGTKRRAVEA